MCISNAAGLGLSCHAGSSFRLNGTHSMDILPPHHLMYTTNHFQITLEKMILDQQVNGLVKTHILKNCYQMLPYLYSIYQVNFESGQKLHPFLIKKKIIPKAFIQGNKLTSCLEVIN